MIRKNNFSMAHLIIQFVRPNRNIAMHCPGHKDGQIYFPGYKYCYEHCTGHTDYQEHCPG